MSGLAPDKTGRRISAFLGQTGRPLRRTLLQEPSHGLSPGPLGPSETPPMLLRGTGFPAIARNVAAHDSTHVRVVCGRAGKTEGGAPAGGGGGGDRHHVAGPGGRNWRPAPRPPWARRQ